ncbi:hypothetical protein [Psychrobacter urativorans]|uniref:hypothetical protein n=1 Tax=Psychrobacter urativorans TaxID=45610 RepID=UPI00191A58D9|nr:hypothetical protein [Psychrobacter urativorans]
MVNLDKTDSSIKTTSSSKSLFSKPLKWQLRTLNILLTILMPLLLSTPDIHLNFYVMS